MRMLLVLTVLFLGYCLPTWSQSGGSVQTDSAAVKIGFPKMLKLTGLGDSLNYKQLLNDRTIAKIENESKNVAKKIYFGQPAKLSVNAPHNYDNMPCLNPKGNFPMPVFKPDSTVDFILLIKK